MKTVLIGEDNQLLAHLWAHVSRNLSLQPEVASTGEQALELASKSRPDLILMDIVMPHMDGLEACRRIMALYHADPPPVIFVSCLARASDMEEAHQLHCADFLVKGKFTLEQFASRIRQVLKQHTDWTQDY